MDKHFSEENLIFSLLCLGSVAISFNVAAIAAAIPTISADLRFPDLWVSKVMPYYMIPYGLGALIYAPLAEKVPFRRILSVSMMVYAGASLLCGLTRSLETLLVARIICGVAGASVIPLGLILIGKMFNQGVRGRLVGLFFTAAFASSLVGTFLSGVANWRWLFLIPSCLAVVVSAGALHGRLKTFSKKHTRRIDYLKVFRHKTLRDVFVFIFAISFLYHGVHKWLGVYFARAYHYKQFTISALFILITVGGALGQNIGGYLADKKGRMRACHIGILMLACATMLLSGIFPLVVLAVILVVFASGWTVGHNGMSTILTDFSDEYRAEIASLNSSVRFLSGGVGFFVSGLFVEQSFQMTFLGIGLLMFLLSFSVKKIIPETLKREKQ